MKVLGNQWLEAPAKRSLWRRLWGMGSKVAVVVLVVVCFSGCAATLTDIRNSHPSRMMFSSLPPQKVANCVVSDAMGEASGDGYWVLVTIVEREGIYNLTVFDRGGPSGELLVKPDGKGGSLIEYRSLVKIEIGGAVREFWKHVEKCADTLPAPGK